MKYWRKRIVYMMAIMLSAGGIAGNMGSEIVLAEEKEKVKGRYAEQKLSLPEENCKAVIDICFLEDGTMRIAYRDSEAKLKTADSKDQGKSWETPRDLWEEFGKSEKAEPMTVNLSKDGGIFSSWNCLEGENTFLAVYLSAEETKKEFDLTLMPEGQGYVYKSQFSPSGNILLMGDKFLCEISREDGRLIRTYESGGYVTDFGIADMTEKYENQYSDSFFPAYQTRWPGVMLRFFGEISASEWMKKDRTLDAEKVKDFFQQVNRIYQAGQKAGNASLDSTYEYAEKMERIYDKNRREESSLNSYLVPCADGQALFSYGYLFSLEELFLLTTIEKQNSDISHRLLNGQAENCFSPEMIMGISVKAREKEAAELFVSFLFSEEQQKNNKEAGFPVRKSVYDSEEYWELGQEGNIEYGFSSTYNGESHDMITVVHSADDQIKEIQKLGKTLTMPSGGSRIIQDSVLEAGKRYLYGGTDLDKAVEQAVSQVKLYLAE